MDVLFLVKHPGHFAHGHAVGDRHIEVVCDAFDFIKIGAGSGYIETTDGVGAVEHDDAHAVFFAGFHHLAHIRQVSIIAGADILKVDNYSIQAGELLI